MKKIKYEIFIYSLNGATAHTYFYADTTQLGSDHAQKLANSGTEGHDWSKKPSWVKYVKYRKVGLVLWKKLYTTIHPVNSNQ